MKYQPLKYIYRPSGNPGAYTILLLHGTGGNEQDLIPIGERFGAEVNLLSVRGNVLEHGMPRFFKRLGMGVFDEQDLEFRTAELVAFLEDIAAEEQFDLHKIIALGYSNGANIAGALLDRNPDFLAGAVLFRPMQPFKALGVLKPSRETPVFMSNGLYDPTIEPAAAQSYPATLKSKGFKVTVLNLPVGHNLTQDDIEGALQWFNQLVAG
jgi:phospholipase/carboxylesterase